MKYLYFLLLSLFSFLHSISAQSYSSCYPYYYYSSYYYFYNNGAYCCYTSSYRASYISSYYAYCPYYTASTTAPAATTSLSNACNYYYYSYYYSSSCCYKDVTAYNAYYSNNYYYTTTDCNLATTTAPSASCYNYYYSSNYGTKCCKFLDTSYSYSTYDTYCPTKSSLTSSSICGSSCCTVYTPVYNGYETFYFPQYFCPDSTSRIYSYCGTFCGMAIVFGILGFCFCICGIAFTIAYCILFDKIIKKKKGAVNQVNSVPNSTHPSAGLQDSTVVRKQDWNRDSLPPQIPGYTFVANPTNTAGTLPYPVQLGGATNVPPNPVQLGGAAFVPPNPLYIPSIETHGAAPYPTFPQPVQTSAADDDTYVSIN